ncbi:MAG: glutathionylspermidine synthase family protein [Chthonomonas sp.]|nr:glutathionylspermidine synthase family protein [Chthonomonas sp.]
MRRVACPPRDNWVEIVEAQGLTYHTHEGKPYWFESARYEFSAREIAELEQATNDLHALCLSAIDEIFARDWLERLHIPAKFHDLMRRSWDDDPPAIYGRFDLAYSGEGPPKLLEYNADTPTSLLEAAVIQWRWLADLHPEADQFNSVWEGLVEKWAALKDEGFFPDGCVHFAHERAWEDLMTITLLRDSAEAAELQTRALHMDEIGWNEGTRRFVDASGEEIETLFKLYPWEQMLDDPFMEFVLESYPRPHWMEPAWKLLLSNKAILPILWELAPGHPNLLPAYDDGPRDLTEFVKKPVFSREGQNIAITTSDAQHYQPGEYDEGKSVWQSYARLPEFGGNHAVIGSWVIDGEARGIGVRESDTPITTDLARFVPHLIVGDE